VLAAPKEEWIPKSWKMILANALNPSHKEQTKKLLKLCMSIYLGGF
jgi:hypothetical protein